MALLNSSASGVEGVIIEAGMGGGVDRIVGVFIANDLNKKIWE